MQRVLTVALLVCTLSVLFSACSDSDEELAPPSSNEVLSCRRLVVVYMMAENNLYYNAELDLNEMFNACDAMPEDCRLVAVVDALGAPRIYEYSREGRRELYTYSQDFISTRPSELEQVLGKIKSFYPNVKSWGLVMWSHGSGWIPGKQQLAGLRSIGVDNGKNTSSNVGEEMDVVDLAQVLERQALHPEYILFDACLMGGIEVAYELRNCCDYVLASPAESPGLGAPYDKIVPALLSSPVDYRKILDEFYNRYASGQGVLYAAVRTAGLPALAAHTQSYVQRLFAHRAEPDMQGVQAHCAWVSAEYWPESYDMKNFFYKYLSESDYVAWSEVFARAVPYARYTRHWSSAYNRKGFVSEITVDPRHYGTLSWFVPHSKYDPQGWNEAFRRTAWYRDAGWVTTEW